MRPTLPASLLVFSLFGVSSALVEGGNWEGRLGLSVSAFSLLVVTPTHTEGSSFQVESFVSLEDTSQHYRHPKIYMTKQWLGIEDTILFMIYG